MEYHRLDSGHLAGLASGLGGAAAVRELVSSRLSRHLLLLKYLTDEWPADRRHLDAAVAVLAEAQRRDPGAFGELMGDPLVGAWLARTTRRLRRSGTHTDPYPLIGDLLQVGGLAAAAGLRIGLDAEVTGYARQGRVTLPTVGDCVLADGADGPMSISVAGGRATLIGAHPVDDGNWRPLRRLTSRHDGMTCTVRLEDGNPYRDAYHEMPSAGLSAREAGRWQDLFAGAWTLICRYLPQRAPELAAGLRALVPLVDRGDGAARSGTARDSAGALGLTCPRSPEDFAITLIHEFQHSKLSAVLDLVPLYLPGGTERHFAPWRTDPRPTGGLIQGVYAFLGVADAWRGLRAAPDLARTATEQLATVREQVRAGVAALERSAELTQPGARFLAGMRAALDRLLAEPLPAGVLDAARASLDERRAAWDVRRHRLNVGQ